MNRVIYPSHLEGNEGNPNTHLNQSIFHHLAINMVIFRLNFVKISLKIANMTLSRHFWDKNLLGLKGRITLEPKVTLVPDGLNLTTI